VKVKFGIQFQFIKLLFKNSSKRLKNEKQPVNIKFGIQSQLISILSKDSREKSKRKKLRRYINLKDNSIITN
jgi:hypothetical protein